MNKKNKIKFFFELGGSPKEKHAFRTTSGIYEVFLERSGRKIWVRGEPSPEPYIPCYMTRTKRSGVRAQRGLSNFLGR